MRGVQISYLIEHPEYIPQLAQWLFEQWGSTLGEKAPEDRIKKLKTHMNRNKLPIAWVAHANGQLLGTAAIRVHDFDGREDLTPWLCSAWRRCSVNSVSIFVRSRAGIGGSAANVVEAATRTRPESARNTERNLDGRRGRSHSQSDE
jgi:hypothetical protein